MAIPSVNVLSPEPLARVARPVDTFMPSPRPNYPAPRQMLGNLVQALSTLAPNLQTYFDKRLTELQTREQAEGFKAALQDQAKDWREAIHKGLVDETVSPFWRKGYMESKGRLAGHNYRQHLLNLYNAWEGKNQIAFEHDPLTGSKVIDHKGFMEFVSQSRNGFLDTASDPDWLNGFRPNMEMAESNLLDHHTAFVQDHLKKDRLDTLYQEVTHHIHQELKAGKSPKDILKSLDFIKQEGHFVGMDKRLIKDGLAEAILLTAQELGSSPGLSLLDSLKKDSPQLAHKINQVQNHLEMELLHEENRTYARREHQRQDNQKRALQFIAEKFEKEGLNWQPDKSLVYQMIQEGVYDFRAKVESVRQTYRDSELFADSEAKNQLYSDLYAGRLNEEEILWQGSSANPQRLLSPQETKEALKILHNETPITQHPLIQDVRRTLANQLAPNMFDRLMNELPGADPERVGIAYQALEELDHRLIEAKKANPALTADPQMLLEHAQELRKTIVEDYKQAQANSHKQESLPSSSSSALKESSLPPEANIKLPFKDNSEFYQALKDFKNGKGKIYEFLKAHKLELTQDQFETFLELQRK